MTVGEKIALLRREKGLSQRALAKAINSAPIVVRNLELGITKESRFLPDIARTLGVSVSDLTGDRLPSNIAIPTAVGEAANLMDSFVSVPEYTVSFSAGNGRELEYEALNEPTPALYRREWFQLRHINPERCKRFKVSGDSMEPLLYDGDTVMALSEPKGTPIRDNHVYLVRYGSELRIKRVVKNLDGSITLRSVNPMYHDYVIPAEEVDTQFEVIGRVVDKSGEGGLRG